MVSRLFETPRNIHRFMWAYMSGMAIVVIYTLVRHAQLVSSMILRIG